MFWGLKKEKPQEKDILELKKEQLLWIHKHLRQLFFGAAVRFNCGIARPFLLEALEPLSERLNESWLSFEGL